MTLPKVKGDLIRSLGEQMNGNIEYIAQVEKDLWEENPDLANVCSNSLDVLNQIFAQHGADIDQEACEQLLLAAQTVGRTTYLLLYQSLKQQCICDELNDG